MKKAGVLLHISSLPGKHGIGTFGMEAYNFIDFLHKSGQSYWQILPFGPLSFGNSPYQSPSIFAGNLYFLDFEILKKEQLLDEQDYINIDFNNNTNKVNYNKLYKNKINILKKTYSNKDKFSKEFKEFNNKYSWWLDDYAIFCTLKDHFNNNPWNTWPHEYKFRIPNALEDFSINFYNEIQVYKFLQFLFYRQWHRLKHYANKKGIEIIGDLPIYVAYDSVDVWRAPELFMLDNNYQPTKIAGVPPDYFSRQGQLWGNPLYNWNEMEKTNYQWWINRLRYSLQCFDIVRIDHFRGFSGYYSIDSEATDASNGEWIKGPGKKLFYEIKKELNNPKIIAEDLGQLDDEVYDLLQYTNFPGMKVLQFELIDRDFIKKLREYNKNIVFYTGTHDNPPICGWYKKLSLKNKKTIKNMLNIRMFEKNKQWKFIEVLYKSDVNTVIVPFQDFIGLGNKFRMNIPSTLDGNWEYRTKKQDFSEELANTIYMNTKLYDRI